MEGVQQGGPLGPLLFCLTIYQIQSQLQSELRLFNLDDCTIGGSLEQILHDLDVIEDESRGLGLSLNQRKSDIICSDPPTCSSLVSIMPDAKRPFCCLPIRVCCGQYIFRLQIHL